MPSRPWSGGHDLISWGYCTLGEPPYTRKRLTVSEPTRPQAGWNINLPKERSANDFPSALPQKELCGTSKMAKSRTGPLPTLRQINPQPREVLTAALITGRFWNSLDLPSGHCSATAKHTLVHTVSWHQHTNQKLRSQKSYKIFNVHLETLTIKDKRKLLALNCLCHNFAISSFGFSSRCYIKTALPSPLIKSQSQDFFSRWG